MLNKLQNFCVANALISLYIVCKIFSFSAKTRYARKRSFLNIVLKFFGAVLMFTFQYSELGQSWYLFVTFCILFVKVKLARDAQDCLQPITAGYSLSDVIWRSGRDKPCCSSRLEFARVHNLVFFSVAPIFCWNWRLFPSFTSKELCTLWICYLQISDDQIRCHTLADFTARILIIKDNSRELRYFIVVFTCT